MLKNISIGSDSVTLTYDDGSVYRYLIENVDPAPVPTPTPAGIIRGGYFDGIPDDKAASYAAEYGMSYVRMWHTVKWEELLGPSHPTFVRARQLQAQGLKTLVVFTPPEKTGAPPDVPDRAAAYFRVAANAANGAVDAWEIWNEPNLANYNITYPTSSTRWIRNALVPAYQELHAARQFVVSGGWSENTSGLPWMIQNGLLTNCDAVGYHPYGSNAAEQVDRVKFVKGLIGDKPLWLTEWNLHMNGKPTWADDLISAASAIKPYVQAVIHFRMLRTAQAAGYGAPFWMDGGTILPTADFHDKLITAMKVFG